MRDQLRVLAEVRDQRVEAGERGVVALEVREGVAFDERGVDAAREQRGDVEGLLRAAARSSEA